MGKLRIMPLTVSPTTWARLAAIDSTHDCRLTRADVQSSSPAPPRVWYVEIWQRHDHSSIIKARAPFLDEALRGALTQIERAGATPLEDHSG
jgi:hypothetical protein